MKKELSSTGRATLLEVLKTRFEENKDRHKNLRWASVKKRLEAHPEKLWSLQEMERTGGEPDVIAQDGMTGKYTYIDCSAESPVGRRSLCYDSEALVSRKEHKPKNSAMGMAAEMNIEIINEADLQKLGKFDVKSSSWIQTPAVIRKLGGALFCDRRYNTVFVYHNGAESYYAARGFRGVLKV